MSRSHRIYRLLEAALGRHRLWRIGRWLYTAARRDLPGDAEDTGEMALAQWIASAWSGEGAPVILDIGANLGDWIEPLLAAFAPQGVRAYAFEPAPQQRARLAERLAPFGNAVTIRPQAMGAEQATGHFRVTGASTGSSALVETGAQNSGIIEVEIETLDRFVATEGIDHVHFVKIDTEGHDLNVLRGAAETLRQNRIEALLFEYNHLWIGTGSTLADVFRLIEPLDYQLGRLTADGIEIFNEWHPELDRFIMTNFLLVGPEMRRRLPCRAYRFDGANVAVPAD